MAGTKTDMVYLASYPKSGNTWLRVFLGYLMQGEKLDINKLSEFSKITSSRILFENIVCENSFELTEAEIAHYRHKAIDLFVEEQKISITYFKSHEAYIKIKYGNWLLPQKPSYKAIYLVRNPFDVCVSFAHHNGQANCNKTIELMCENRMKTKGNNTLFSEHLGSWSENIKSWLKNFPKDRLLVVRYEDMLLNSFETFSRITEFIGLNYTTGQIETAIEKSSFNELKEKENNTPFFEKPVNSIRFFRKGKNGEGNEILSEFQKERIIKCHKEMMLRFDYL